MWARAAVTKPRFPVEMPACAQKVQKDELQRPVFPWGQDLNPVGSSKAKK